MSLSSVTQRFNLPADTSFWQSSMQLKSCYYENRHSLSWLVILAKLSNILLHSYRENKLRLLTQCILLIFGKGDVRISMVTVPRGCYLKTGQCMLPSVGHVQQLLSCSKIKGISHPHKAFCLWRQQYKMHKSFILHCCSTTGYYISLNVC